MASVNDAIYRLLAVLMNLLRGSFMVNFILTSRGDR